MSRTNNMGVPLAPHEAELVECYEKLLRTVKEHRGRLAPFEERNALKALSCLWQVMNGLDMDPEHLYDVGA